VTRAAPFMPIPRPVCWPLTDAREAELRARLVAEAWSWNGTPYVAQGAIKGACVDCAMLNVRVWIDAGLVAPFDPRPYDPQWYLHHADELYLGWLQRVAVEVETPRAGDLVVWHFGRCFSHGGIMVSGTAAMQASAAHGRCYAADLSEAWLRWVGRGTPAPRPRKFFDVFAGIRRWAIEGNGRPIAAEAF
jgi:cell wall-associated NlpC family hydrolase